MVEFKTIARPYAEAVFQECGSDKLNQLNWKCFLECSSNILENEDSLKILSSPDLDPVTKQDLLFGLVNDISTASNSGYISNIEFIKTIAPINFIKLLIGNSKLALIPEIFRQFESLRLKQNNIIVVEVSSAYPVNENQKNSLIKALEKRFSKNIELKIHLDPLLIGGITIKANDIVMDGSVKGRLTQLYQTLIG